MRRFVTPMLGLLVALSLLSFDLTILRSGRTALRPTMQKGVALGIFKASEGMSYYQSSIDEIYTLGATHISIPVYYLQDSAHAVTLYCRPTDGATPEQYDQVIREVIEYSHRLGMKVLLTPIIDIDHPKNKEWRGVISPGNWDAWFESYTVFIMHYARLAEDLDVEFMSVGTELVSSEGFTDQWRAVIREVRGIYDGQLTYSANWDHYEAVAFWDDLDFLGLSGYFELFSFENPTVEDIVDGWISVKENLHHWQARWQKPFLFIEIGYMSQEGVASQPWNYVSKAPLNLEEQKRCYEALRRSWENENNFAGLYLWIWEPNKQGLNDKSYNFDGKPAEDIVRDWYQNIPPNATILDVTVITVERFFRSLRQGL
ncbi:MAG: hypothetical protein QGI34_08500 [Candidatus Latescibacteria bacterium]|nr:hypothetical protein [Candidatus Latescibacterota bacterium]